MEQKYFGNIFNKLSEAETDIANLEKQLSDSLSENDHLLLKKAQANYIQYSAHINTYYRQKAKINWLKEGDANTKYFHLSLKAKHNRLNISRIKLDNGVWIDSADDICNSAVAYYSDLLNADDETDSLDHADYLRNIKQIISQEDNIHLMRPITKDELKEAVFSLGKNSAPGIDGFDGVFYQCAYAIIEDDLLNAVREFFCGVPVPKSIGHTLIALIPKEPNAYKFSKFRPISLSNFSNKIFTKILTNRITHLLPKIISDEQSAFQPGKEISDGILVLRELVNHINKKTRGHNIIFKFDMNKAFDRISWPFINSVLLSFGFHPAFIKLIMNNLHATWCSILINGTPKGFFKPSRGVKQGDPLSPILFIIVAEVLSRNLKLFYSSGRGTPFNTYRGMPCLSHLSFADDLVVFSNAGKNTMVGLHNTITELIMGAAHFGSLIGVTLGPFITTGMLSPPLRPI
ncbi:unnamed protein product [Cuscuta epithymum]|uniref:Reverse transcriptase domain-containing protein n=1 Tax=Cuscuta epithymum TaxID=186058 RepID=A0AAV0DME0_9ASTE|nr:unnamed protein product [Cuscuta epithymum]